MHGSSQTSVSPMIQSQSAYRFDARNSSYFLLIQDISRCPSIRVAFRKSIFGFLRRWTLDNDVFTFPPTNFQTDYLFLESTYGNRLHPDTDLKTRVGNVHQQRYCQRQDSNFAPVCSQKEELLGVMFYYV